jgi:hypothetical protein
MFAVWPPYNTSLISYNNPSFVVDSDATNDITLVTGFKVSGYVCYPSGEAVAGVSTYLLDSSGVMFNAGRWSEASGYYYNVAPAGTYTLRAMGLSGSGISYSEANVIVDGDTTQNITLIDVSNSPTSATLDVGQAQLFNATPSGGSGSYTTYVWYVNDSAKSARSNSVFSFEPDSAGVYLITSVVKDTTGATSSRSTVTSVTVNPALTATTISASNDIIDQTQTSVLNSTDIVTGTDPYSYQWYAKAPEDSNYTAIDSATLPEYSFITSSSTAIGVWSFILNVTDSADTPVTVSSNEVSVTVNAIPTVTVFPQNAVLDMGSSTNFTASVSGGSGFLRYQWFLDDVAVGDDSSSYLYNATQGAHMIFVNVTDSANPPLWATSNVVSVTVNSVLTAPSVAASNDTVYQGQTSSLTSTAVSTGTSPYNYQWFAKAPNGNFSLIVDATADSYNFSTSKSTAVGVWSFVLNVTDSATTPVTVTSIEASVKVNAAPAVTISPQAAALDVGQTQLFIATPSNGSGLYTSYQWHIDGTPQVGQNSSTFNYSFVSVGSHSVTATVTDSSGLTSAQSSATITVNPALAAPTVTIAPSIVFQGKTSTVTATVTTGTSPYTYKWYAIAPDNNVYSAVNGATSASYRFVTSSSSAIGVWSFKVQVTDATGETVNSTATTVTVNPALTVTIAPETATLNVGQSELFTAMPIGGSGTYLNYKWYVNGSAQAGQTGSTFNYSPASTGTYAITATVTDSSGAASPKSVPAIAQAAVTPTPTPAPTQTASPTPTLTPMPTSTATPAPTITTTPTVPASPSTKPEPQQGSNFDTFILPITAAVIIVVVIAGVVFSFRKRKNTAKN